MLEPRTTRRKNDGDKLQEKESHWAGSFSQQRLSYAPDYQGRGFSLIFAFISASKHRKYFY
jgi:hypothetical protein